MLGKLTNGKIVMDICLPKSLKETIDQKRGDIPRSKTFLVYLNDNLNMKMRVKQQNMSKPSRR